MVERDRSSPKPFAARLPPAAAPFAEAVLCGLQEHPLFGLATRRPPRLVADDYPPGSLLARFVWYVSWPAEPGMEARSSDADHVADDLMHRPAHSVDSRYSLVPKTDTCDRHHCRFLSQSESSHGFRRECPSQTVHSEQRHTDTDARHITGDHESEFDGLEALEQLVRSLDTEARLTPAGRTRAGRSLIRSLVERLEASLRTAERPEMTNRSLRPIIITGMLCNGTTFLQRLLAQHPGLRAPALWGMTAPARRGKADELIGQCAAYIAEYDRLAPGFKNIHSLRVEFPEECHRLIGNTFCDPIFAFRYHVPSYVKWLDRQSMEPVYRYHRTQLQVLLDRILGGSVLLKGPSHLWYQGELAAVYPDALVVRMHRSPAVAPPSVCSLISVVRGASADPVEDREIGRYAGLGADPMAVVARICTAAELPLTDAARRRMNGHLPTGRATGRHAYRAERFGHRADRLADRFSDYLDEFVIPHEA